MIGARARERTQYTLDTTGQYTVDARKGSRTGRRTYTQYTMNTRQEDRQENIHTVHKGHTTGRQARAHTPRPEWFHDRTDRSAR